MKAGLATSLSIAGVLATGGAALVLNSSILDTASTAKGSPALATVVGLNDQATNLEVAGGAAGGSVTASGLADVVNGVEAPMSVDNPAPMVAAPSAAITPNTTSQAGASANGNAAESVTQNGAAIAVDEPTTTIDATPTPTSTPSTTPTTAPASPVAPTTTVAPAVDKQFAINGVATVTLTAANGKLTVKSIDLVAGSGYKVGNQYSHDGDDIRITFTSSTRTVEFSARLVRGQIVAAIGNPGNGNLMPPPPGDNHERHDGQDRDGDHEEHERENDDD